ncbi:MAG: galM [Proteobacteria bacterium]|nr:galM [Pseudomonadota bacterium]
MSCAEALCPDGQPPRLIELAADCGTRLSLMDWGGTLLSCRVAVGGAEREVLLGCARLADYFTQTAFLGATIGRYANRIGGAQFTHGGRTIALTPTADGHQLHGGPQGFDRRRWRIVQQQANAVVLGIESAAGDQGFPGKLSATVRYRLDGEGRLGIDYTAKVDAPCPVNLTNHAYFNLDGAATDIRQHRLQIHAQHYLPVDCELIPLGQLQRVAGTGFDFSKAKLIGSDFLSDEQQRLAQGYDHAYLLDQQCRGMAGVAATVVAGDGRLAMDVYTSKPALQFYSGNFLAGVPARDGGTYSAHQGFALETQFLPDSPNHPEWPQPDCWLYPGETYQHSTVLAFRSA